MTYDESIRQIKMVIPKNQIMISQKDVNQLTGISITSLNKDIKEGKGIPYKLVRSKVFYTIVDIAKWMSNTETIVKAD